MNLLDLDLRKLCGLSPRERFYESYVPVPESGCWIWLGKTSGGRKDGSFRYGRIYINGKYRQAHRVSYQMHNGEISEEDVVMHTCDNTLCVNPNHLMKGTQGDNIRDCAQKGRIYKPDVTGKKNGRYKDGSRIRDVLQPPA